MTYTKIAYEVSGGIAHIAMDAPKNLNAFDGTMIAELIAAFEAASEDEAVRSVLLSSTGRAFCGGGDLGTMYKGIKAGQTDFSEDLKDAAALMRAMKRCPKPIVGAVNGAAAGAGFPLALGCDYVIADENATFIAAFVNVGLVPDTGGLYVLCRALGVNKAVELAMTGRPVDAQEAKALGFIAEIVAPDSLAEAAEKAARRFAKGPAASYAKMKELVYAYEFSDFDRYMPDEVGAQIECMGTQDFRDRVVAFIEKK